MPAFRHRVSEDAEQRSRTGISGLAPKLEPPSVRARGEKWLGKQRFAYSKTCPRRGSDAPNGIRTRVAALKGQSPRPLDDGDRAGDISEWRTVFGMQKARSRIGVIRSAPGPVAAVVWLTGRLTAPVLPRCAWGRVP